MYSTRAATHCIQSVLNTGAFALRTDGIRVANYELWLLLRRPLTVQEERVTVVNLSDVELINVRLQRHRRRCRGGGSWGLDPTKILAAGVFSGLDPNENLTEINLMSAKSTSGAVL